MNSPWKRLGLYTLSVMLAAGFWGCPSSTSQAPVDYARFPIGLSMDTLPADHPFCEDPGPAFADKASCQAAQKFRISWGHPEDTLGLRGFRLYLDTLAPSNSTGPIRWPDIVKRGDLADVIVLNANGPTDSLIIAIGQARTKPDTVDADNPRIILLDTANRVKKDDSLVLALLAVYDDDGSSKIAYSTAISLGDNFPPIPVIPELKASAKEIRIQWFRPIDPTSFFNSSADTGVIDSYALDVKLKGKRPGAFTPSIAYRVEGRETLPADTVEIRNSDNAITGYSYTLPDGGYFRRNPPDSGGSHFANRIEATLGGLRPQDTLLIKIMPVDQSGNKPKAITEYTVILTDTTQPRKPSLLTDSTGITRNRIAFYWFPSRDSLDSDKNGQLEEGPVPDYGIREYRLRKEWLRDSTVLTRRDTVLPAGLPTTRDRYLDTLKFLPPGTAYRVVLIAVDSSGHSSLADTSVMRTLGISLGDTASDSVLSCPPGFSPIPGRRVVLGDTGNSAVADERPGKDPATGKDRSPFISSFCIESYEHRDVSGRFMNSVSWGQADSICNDLSPADSTRLCSEAQWETACKSDDSLALVYGYQGDNANPGLLRTACNQGTGDSVPAIDLALRDSRCLTHEGVFDLPGQFSEWVRDEYMPTAYGNTTQDTLPYSFAFGSPGANATHVFRGGNFLKPSLSSAQIQTLARCSNRDTPRQVRPRFKPECRDTVPQILASFGAEFNQHHCMPLPNPSSWREVSDVRPLDGKRILVFRRGGGSDTVDIPQDSISKDKRPVTVGLTQISLAAVTFLGSLGDTLPDTLDAQEFRDTSAGVWERVLKREAGIGYQALKKGNDYAVTFLYANAQAGSRPARPSYSSRAIAFRCCAKPRPMARMPEAGPPDAAPGP